MSIMDASNTCTRSKMGGPMEENLGLLKNYWCNRRMNQPDYPIDSGLKLSQVIQFSGDWFSAYRPNSRSMAFPTSQVQIAAIMAARLWLAAFYMCPGSLNLFLEVSEIVSAVHYRCYNRTSGERTRKQCSVLLFQMR